MTAQYPFGTIIQVRENPNTPGLPAVANVPIMVLRSDIPGVVCHGLLLEEGAGFNRGSTVFVFVTDVVDVLEITIPRRLPVVARADFHINFDPNE